MRVEGTARLWRSSNTLKLNIPRELFMLLAGLGKKDARELGFKGYMAVTREGCLKIAVSRAPPEWAQHAASVDTLGQFYLPRAMVEALGLRPGEYRIVVEVSEDGRHAILCPQSHGQGGA